MAAEVKRESTVAQIRRILADRILDGELAPGTRLRELHVAAELKVSQAPVREAFRELEMLGLVQTQPYRGTSVREITKADIRDAYIVRASLEEVAGRLAAPVLKGSVDHLRELATKIRKAALQGDIATYVKFDVHLHHSIVQAAGNKVLLRSWDALGFEIRMQIRLTNSKTDLVKYEKEHWPIIDALERGAGREAGSLLQQHIFKFSK